MDYSRKALTAKTLLKTASETTKRLLEDLKEKADNATGFEITLEDWKQYYEYSAFPPPKGSELWLILDSIFSECDIYVCDTNVTIKWELDEDE